MAASCRPDGPQLRSCGLRSKTPLCGHVSISRKGILYLALSTLSALRSFVKLAQSEFLLLFKEFAEVNRLGDFIIRNLRGRMAIQNVSVIVTLHRTCEP